LLQLYIPKNTSYLLGCQTCGLLQPAPPLLQSAVTIHTYQPSLSLENTFFAAFLQFAEVTIVVQSWLFIYTQKCLSGLPTDIWGFAQKWKCYKPTTNTCRFADFLSDWASLVEYG